MKRYAFQSPSRTENLLHGSAMRSTILDPVFYDFEASGLNGFPIEIGWAYAHNKSASIVAEGHLIRPAIEWHTAADWDTDAEGLHGLTLDLLMREGKPAHSVASRLNEALRNRSLFADSPFDEGWLIQLFDAAGLSPTFQVRRTAPEILARQFAADHRLPSAAVDQAIASAQRDHPQGHRAVRDASHWAAVWLMLLRQAETE